MKIHIIKLILKVGVGPLEILFLFQKTCEFYETPMSSSFVGSQPRLSSSLPITSLLSGVRVCCPPRSQEGVKLPTPS